MGGRVMLAAALMLAAPVAVRAAAPPDTCTALRTLALPDFRVEAAEPVAAAAGQPAHCRLAATIDPRIAKDGTAYGIGIDLRLPADWNGRFLFQGGGGMDGVRVPAFGDLGGRLAPSALARGFAVVSSDGGHRGHSPIDADFGRDQQARVDYAYAALDRVTRMAKAIVTRHYGRAPRFSYLLGCSNGGRQGLIAAERMPLAFDGIVAGDPPFNFSRTVLAQIWNLQQLTAIAPRDAEGRPILSRALSDQDLALVGRAVLTACDGLDGLEDGLIADSRACRFDPAILTCTGGKTAACLTAPQVAALKAVADGPRDRTGRPLYGRFPFDTGIADPAWRSMHLGTSQTPVPNAADRILGAAVLGRYLMTPPDPVVDPLRFDMGRDRPRIAQTSALGDADGTDFSTFRQRAKLLLYQGVSDQGVAAGALTDWFDRVQADNGGAAAVADWGRLFLVPGMMHCGGGHSTDRFDMLAAIQAWVEEGRAPDRIVATGIALPGVSRPLCPYPAVARYTGGPATDAASFTCRP